MENNKKIEAFLELIKTEVYSEPDTPMHTSMIDMVIKDLGENQLGDNKSISILDIGCGQGYAMTKFKELGFENLQGITMSQEDVDATIKRGFKCENMDQSFMTFSDNSYDFMFSRHCLEHSPFPYYTLMEYFRVCKPEGKIYIEMPAPDNHRPLENIANHYSILGVKMWIALMQRTGWKILVATDFTIKLTDQNNPDKPFDEKNLVFVLQKPTIEQSTK
jgi:ubiquinone/menaquinone biosynthesis C-methylase UbiE